MASGLLDKANIILTPTGYKAGTMYNVAPIEQPYEDFVFSRASVASRVNSSGLVEMVGRTLGSNLVQNGDFSELGSELVTSWTNKDFTSFSSSGSNITQMVSSANGNNCYSATTITSGKTYKLEFTCSQNILAQIRLSNNTNLTSAQTALSNPTLGLNTVYFTASSNYNYIGFYAASTFTDTQISSFTLKQLDPNDYWNLETGWSLGDNQAIKTGSVASNFYQYSVFTTGQTYKLSFTISNSNDGRLLVYIGGNSVTEDITNTSNGTYTFYANSDNVNLVFRNVTFEGSITNVTAQEVIDTNNIPRINYDSNGENGHWLLEPTSTNLITYSEDFSQSDWSKTDVLIENGYTAPDGSSTAYKVTNNGANAHLKGYFGINTNKRKSIWAKTVSGSGDVYLLNGNGINLFSLTNEWQRFDITHSGVNNFFYAVDFRGASTTLSEVIIWGCQLEDLSYATSYIPTLTGSTETRATETSTGAGSADLINSTEGVLYAEIAALADDGTNRLISLSNADTSQQIWLYFNTSNGLTYRIYNGSTQSTYTHSINTKTFNKIAVKYKANDFGLFVNGTKVYTDTSGSTFTENTLTKLNFDAGDGALDFYGEVKELVVFGEALSDDELEKLTSWSSFNAMATDLGYTIE